MPRGVKQKPVEFLRLGTIAITKEDKWNWSVSGDGRITYHVSLPLAIMAAAHRGTDAKSRDAWEWLAEYKRITLKLVDALPELIDSKRAMISKIDRKTPTHIKRSSRG